MHTPSLARVLTLLVLARLCLGVRQRTGGSQQVPTGPTPPTPPPGGGGAVTLTAPVAVSPVNGEQLSTLRPTLTVQNGTSTAQGTRTYEFQISDRTDFTLGATLAASFLVAVNQTGVAEGSDGRTIFAVAAGAATDDADVLAVAGRPGHLDLRLVAAGDVQDQADGLLAARRAVRPADSQRNDRQRFTAHTRGSRAKGFDSTRKTRSSGISWRRRWRAANSQSRSKACIPTARRTS